MIASPTATNVEFRLWCNLNGYLIGWLFNIFLFSLTDAPTFNSIFSILLPLLLILYKYHAESQEVEDSHWEIIKKVDSTDLAREGTLQGGLWFVR